MDCNINDVVGKISKSSYLYAFINLLLYSAYYLKHIIVDITGHVLFFHIVSIKIVLNYLKVIWLKILYFV